MGLINALDILFAYLAITNLQYSLFEKHVEGFSPLSISDASEDPIIGIYFGQYSNLVIDFPLDADENNDRKEANNKAANNRAVANGTMDNGGADDGTANNGVANNDNDQEKNNDQNSDGGNKEKQGELDHSKKSSFLDKTWSPILVIPEKTLLDIVGDVKPRTVTSDADKK